jgi:hypothetical protein
LHISGIRKEREQGLVRAKAAVWADRILAGDVKSGTLDVRRPVNVECHIFVPPLYVREKELSKHRQRMPAALDWCVGGKIFTDVIEVGYEIAFVQRLAGVTYV